MRKLNSCIFSQLLIHIPTLIHDTDHRDDLRIRDIENKIVVDRHDARPALVSGFPRVCPVPLRHGFLTEYCLPQPFQLSRGVLDRAEIDGDIRKNPTQIGVRLF